MKSLVLAKRGCPLDRNRSVPGAGDGAQQHGSLDVIVVGNRNQRLQLEPLRDLPAFQIKGQARRERWRPVASGVVDFQGMLAARETLFAGDNSPEVAVLVGEFYDEVERFLRTVGMAVKRNPSGIAASGAIVIPQI